MVILIEMNCVIVRALVFSNFELKLSRSIYERNLKAETLLLVFTEINRLWSEACDMNYTLKFKLRTKIWLSLWILISLLEVTLIPFCGQKVEI